jgi:transcriptional regulator with XRE-family HTH domain
MELLLYLCIKLSMIIMAKSEIIPTSFRIKEILDERRLSQAQLAEGLGVSASAVKQFLDAESLSTTTLQKIAQYLDVPLWQLLISPHEIIEEAKEALSLQDDSRSTIIVCPYCKKEIEINLHVSKPI